MFQIDNSTAVAAIPAPTPAGSAGYFTDGNPATGVSATILPAEFMNMLMMENMNVLSAAGITPAKGQYNQLALAIAKIVQSGAAGPASEATAGILKLATSPQALAGTDDSTAITPLKLAQKLANFLGQATEAAFGWLKIATQALVNAGADDATAVTPKKLAAAIQNQALTAFTTAGSTGSLTLTPAPAIQAYATPLRFRVKFSLASAGADTLNVSGLGPKNLKQYDSTGAKVPAVFAATQLADVEYDGTDFVLLDQLPSASISYGVRGARSNLKVSASGSSSVVSITADELTLKAADGTYVTISAVAVSASFAVAGYSGPNLGGLDVGAANSQTIATWYAVYVAWNKTTSERIGLLSLNGTAPTLPAGFTHYARVSYCRPDSTGNKYPLNYSQVNDHAQWRVGANISATLIMAQGVQGAASGTPTFSAVSVSPFVPPSASAISCTLHNTNGGTGAITAPSGAYGGYDSTTNLCPLVATGPTGVSLNMNVSAVMALESANIYYASSSNTGALCCNGWVDNL